MTNLTSDFNINENMDNLDVVLIKMPQIPIIVSVSCCFTLSIIFVASLYVWNTDQNRDHPATVKRRFCSVIIVMLIAPVFLYKFSAPELLAHVSFFELLGLRTQSLLQAIFIPYLLTMLLFLGPLVEELHNDSIKVMFDYGFWKHNLTNLLWLRNHIVAPLSEEFVYRACMMPLILQSFSPMASVFITPLFFGTAHVHHIVERLRMGIEWKTALLISCFQMLYTTLFGFYSAFLFARTGHFVAPFLVHAFCNHMGIPVHAWALGQLPLYRRLLIISAYIIGFVGWIILLPIATEPKFYSNKLFWKI